MVHPEGGSGRCSGKGRRDVEAGLQEIYAASHNTFRPEHAQKQSPPTRLQFSDVFTAMIIVVGSA